jgi:hypothetical protein
VAIVDARAQRANSGFVDTERGGDLFLFSSDYPHREGTKNPIERFESTMHGMTDDQRARFYHRNYESMMRGAG